MSAPNADAPLPPYEQGVIGFFVRHPNASNLLMAVLLIAGLASLSRLNTQFFPTVNVPFVSVSVIWSGASAEDVEGNIIEALEPGLRGIDGLKKLTSTASEGSAVITLEFWLGTDIQKVVADVEQQVTQVTTLPIDSERPIISQAVFSETIGRIAISGPFTEKTLKVYAKKMKNDLLRLGLDKVQIEGSRAEEIWVEIVPEELRRLGLTPDHVARRISALSQDLPSGTLGGSAERQVRALGFEINAESLAETEVRAEGGDKLLLSDIATVEEAFGERQAAGFVGGNSALQIDIQRAESTDTLEASETIQNYVKDARQRFPQSLNIKLYDLRGDYVQQRIDLLGNNAMMGFFLVLLVLFLFLNARVAFWVAAGIPISFVAAFSVIYMQGLSINMLSLFAMLMMLGIVVDDAIVVGEHSATLRERGMSPKEAAHEGARRMMGPVLASSLTTIAAFLPIFLIRGVMGEFMATLGLVVIAIIIASLFECFFILPGHMRHALLPGRRRTSEAALQKSRLGHLFEDFREGPFTTLLEIAYRRRGVTISLALSSLFIMLALMASGRVGFEFFPAPEAEDATAHVFFVPGTPRERSRAALSALEESLARAEKRLIPENGGADLVQARFGLLGRAGSSEDGGRSVGDHVAELFVELMPSETRRVRTARFLQVWEEELPVFAGLDKIVIRTSQAGPPGSDIDVQLEDVPVNRLKEAAGELVLELQRFDGVSNVTDTLPYGKEEIVLEVTPRGKALGFTAQDVGRQMRNAVDGAIARRFARGDEEITVRVRLPKGSSRLSELYLESPRSGGLVPLNDIVSMREKTGFMTITRVDGMRSVSVTGQIDPNVSSTGRVQSALEERIMPRLAEKYALSYSYKGRSEEESVAFQDLTTGLYVALALIYLILAWIFGHYGLPLVVMSIIPFGVVGAALGHLLMGYPLTFLSMLALLGLSGILVNGSIVLVTQIQAHLSRGMAMRDAVMQGTKDRLRPVLLTTFTTVVGLAPLMFEGSLQAQFLKPMGITLVFGLSVGTFLVLFIVPALLGFQDSVSRRIWGEGEEGEREAPDAPAPLAT